MKTGSWLFKLQSVGYSAAKVILAGEHAAVYGFPAVAVALPNISLQITIQPPNDNPPISWLEAWSISDGNDCQMPVPQENQERLVKLLIKCLSFFDIPKDLYSYIPQNIDIKTAIPLGGGLGGSAALCVALLRAISKAFNRPFTDAEFIEKANILDSIFHGHASGLDVTTVVLGKIIEFSKGKIPSTINIGKKFWIGLVDSGERTATKTMVSKVAQMHVGYESIIHATCEHIGTQTKHAIQAIRAGNISELGEILSKTHDYLKQLGVSTPRLNSIVNTLTQCGALGAKLTGGGGGGMALGIFATNPSDILKEAFPDQLILVSEIEQ